MSFHVTLLSLRGERQGYRVCFLSILTINTSFSGIFPKVSLPTAPRKSSLAFPNEHPLSLLDVQVPKGTRVLGFHADSSPGFLHDLLSFELVVPQFPAHCPIFRGTSFFKNINLEESAHFIGIKHILRSH